ncbi:flippase-like domain-containing protein [Candidatus Atribacteria bacterium MT.SAG.1]|nr:flippase-like domain-containing protein [Candidatus Atribacteria bacterium MT.SAG.1]
MKNLFKLLAASSIGLLIFLFVMRIVGWSKINEAIVLFSGFRGLIIVLLTFFIATVSCLNWKLILRSQGFNVSIKELIKLWLAGFSISYLTPFAFLGGEVLQIYFLNKKFNISWEKSTASVLIRKILSATFFLLFLVTGVLSFYFYGYFPSGTIIWLVFLVIGGLLGSLLFFYFKILNKESILRFLLKFIGVKKEKIENHKNGKLIFDVEKEIIKFFSLKNKIFWKSFMLSFLRYSLLFFRTGLIIFFLGESIQALKVLSIYGFTNFALIFPFPAGIGSLEASSAFTFNALGMGAGNGTIYAMTLRVADLFLCLLGVVISIKLGLNLAEKKLLNFVNRLKS